MRWTVVAAALAVGCSGGSTPESDEKSDSGLADADADADADSDADADADADSDADVDLQQSLAQKVGHATVTADYIGTEELQLVDDAGEGPLQCQIVYDVTSIAPRTDCAACLWAFDLVISNATVSIDDGAACLTAFGIDANNVVTLNGQALSYGYNPDYFGHAQVLMTSTDGATWSAANYAVFDEATGTFDYEWADGLITY